MTDTCPPITSSSSFVSAVHNWDGRRRSSSVERYSYCSKQKMGADLLQLGTPLLQKPIQLWAAIGEPRPTALVSTASLLQFEHE